MALSGSTRPGLALVNSFKTSESGEQTCILSALTFDGVPERRDSLGILVQGDSEAVHLLLILHEEKRLQCGG